MNNSVRARIQIILLAQLILSFAFVHINRFQKTSKRSQTLLAMLFRADNFQKIFFFIFHISLIVVDDAIRICDSDVAFDNIIDHAFECTLQSHKRIFGLCAPSIRLMESLMICICVHNFYSSFRGGKQFETISKPWPSCYCCELVSNKQSKHDWMLLMFSAFDVRHTGSKNVPKSAYCLCFFIHFFDSSGPHHVVKTISISNCQFVGRKSVLMASIYCQKMHLPFDWMIIMFWIFRAHRSNSTATATHTKWATECINHVVVMTVIRNSNSMKEKKNDNNDSNIWLNPLYRWKHLECMCVFYGNGMCTMYHITHIQTEKL